MKYIKLASFALAVLQLFYSCSDPQSGTVESSQDSVQQLFATHCATCHMDNGQSRAPGLIHLGAMTPRSILAALEQGTMQEQGKLLSRPQKVAVAELLTLRKYTSEESAVNFCDDQKLDLKQVKYSGWGGNKEGTGKISREVAQLRAEEVPHLKLKWAFAFEGGTVTRTKPAVIDHYLIFGSQYGEVYCLDMFTGCVEVDV